MKKKRALSPLTFAVRNMLFGLKVKQGRGRPRLPEEEKRSVCLPIRLNTHEEQVVRKAAKKSGKRFFTWMRETLLAAAK